MLLPSVSTDYRVARQGLARALNALGGAGGRSFAANQPLANRPRARGFGPGTGRRPRGGLFPTPPENFFAPDDILSEDPTTGGGGPPPGPPPPGGPQDSPLADPTARPVYSDVWNDPGFNKPLLGTTGSQDEGLMDPDGWAPDTTVQAASPADEMVRYLDPETNEWIWVPASVAQVLGG